jgi:cytochrome c biogenesis protein CcmG/thiol:disulfide interchange protein DsbE
MRRFMLPGLVVLAAAALLALLAFGVASQGPDTSIDAKLARGQRPPAPSAGLALPLLGAGRTERLAALRGKVVVLNVFASWCTQCRPEAPILERAQRTLEGRNATVLGVTYLDNSGDSERFVSQEHITYPVLRDVSGTLVRSLGATGVPETFVIDRRGRVAALRRYPVDDQWLNQTLLPLLAERS